jgi:uncharacterized protein (TIGR00255 family)
MFIFFLKMINGTAKIRKILFEMTDCNSFRKNKLLLLCIMHLRILSVLTPIFMLQSMTGFGSATLENETISVTAEVKTLNSKFTDVFCRIPRTFSDREIEIRKLLSDRLERGKIEFMLNVTPKDAESAGTAVNRAVVKAYFRDLMATANELGFEPGQTELLRIASMMPNAYISNTLSTEKAEAEWILIKQTVENAIAKCLEFRNQEGTATGLKLVEYIEQIGTFLTAVEAQDPTRVPVVRERLEKAVAEWSSNELFDRNRARIYLFC